MLAPTMSVEGLLLDFGGLSLQSLRASSPFLKKGSLGAVFFIGEYSLLPSSNYKGVGCVPAVGEGSPLPP